MGRKKRGKVNGEREREGTAGSQQQMVSGFLPAELSLSSLLSLSLSALLPHVLSCTSYNVSPHLGVLGHVRCLRCLPSYARLKRLLLARFGQLNSCHRSGYLFYWSKMLNDKLKFHQNNSSDNECILQASVVCLGQS